MDMYVLFSVMININFVPGCFFILLQTVLGSLWESQKKSDIAEKVLFAHYIVYCLIHYDDDIAKLLNLINHMRALSIQADP